ncbi:glycoside hydrolase family 36 protein [Microbacterium sp. MPKO10]|uniref:glycoside hydrolase family 36 protein n=1 Tax=Microbacterium sp. MPKO10 TaxID=2989818 RepID=UPI0022369DAC|nr:glycoside hydrolase family 36 protein [Microbacterium sp. MPKO10]MCW4457106.1 alpha-galactosidase [Microbacterium sp. MPKO10]
MTGPITWRPGSLEVVIDCEATPPRVAYIGAQGESGWSAGSAGLPLAEVRVAGEGNAIASSERLMGSALSRRMRYVSHDETTEGDSSRLEVTMRDPGSSLTVVTRLRSWRDIAVVRWQTDVINDGDAAADVQLLSSFALGGLTAPGSAWWNDQRVAFADNSWFREASWQHSPPGDLGLDDVGLAQWRYAGSRASFSLTGRGSWSSGGHLPLGMLSANDGSRSTLWQIENNGGWRWEIGDWEGALYVVGTGPTDQAHAWTRRLAPGERFRGVAAAVAVARGDDAAFAAMNAYRRRIRRPHPDNERLPVIFNDFMNALMGDPTTEKLRPLIDAAASAGAEYFCIDAGWHADDRAWWDAVGEWRETPWRFPGGLSEVTERIRTAGMIAGLWLEPESIGVRSTAADELPHEAFFQRDGVRVIEAGRYQLDFRHPAVIDRLNGVVERLITDYGVGYLKFDYNVDVTQGTDVSGSSPGDGQLEHGRAYLEWVSSLLDRHPTLVIENCASGGQRMDYASLALHPVQSTSDNQDPLHYAPIAAAAPTAVTPEQGAVWAYPNADWSSERLAFSMVNSLLGRVHLGGRLDLLDRQQAEQVREAITVYRGIRADLAVSAPIWPHGLPGWHDDVLSLGLTAANRTYLSVWRRSGPTSVEIPLQEFTGLAIEVSCLYPTALPTQTEWNGASGVLTVTLPDEPAARLLMLRHVS